MGLIFSSPKTILPAFLMLLLSMTQANANQPIESAVWKSAAAATAVLIATTNAFQTDRMSLELGGGEHVYVIRVGLQWDWKDDLMTVFGWNLDSYWLLDFSKWQSTRDSSQEGANVTVGFTPVFRFSREKSGIQSYLDVGAGAYLFTDSRLEDHEFGSNLQFSPIFGVGGKFGQRHQWDLGYKFQHYSNGSIKTPNHGINFHFLNLSYEY